MKKTIMMALAGAMLALGLATAAGAQTDRHHRRGNINARERYQQQRIAEGIENGSLNPREAARLEAQEAKLRGLEARLRDDGLKPSERARLERDLNKLSREIYQQKHDRQHGYAGVRP